MKQAVTRFVLSAAVTLAVVLGGCSGGGGSGGGDYWLDGSYTDTDVSGGELAYIRLVAAGAGEAAPAIYSAVSTAFDADKSATYSIGGIAAGTYDRYVFVDLDGNGVKSMGDHETDVDTFTFPPDQVEVLFGGDGTWTVVP